MEYYGEFVAWSSYSKAQLVLAEMQEERELDRLENLSAVTLLGMHDPTAKGELATIMKARRDADPQIVHQKEAHRTAKMYRKLVDTMFDRCERSSQFLSRELTRRLSMSHTSSQHDRHAP